MSVNLRIFTLTALLVWLIPQSVMTAQEKTAWWKPFSSSTTTTSESANATVRKSTQFGGGGSSFFKFPEVKMPTWSDKVKTQSEPKKNGPSTLSRMGTTSKRWWNNSVDFINPFDSKPQSTQQGYQPQNNKTSKKGTGPFGWMWREEKTEAPNNVNDFLKQPRPGFDNS